MRYALGTIGVIAATVLLLVAGAMNWRFGFNLGKTELDAQIYGAASAASDGLKALLPFIVLWALKQRNIVQALAGTLVWVICTTYSLTASLGFAALNRADTVGERVVVANEYKDLRADLKRSMEKSGWIPQHRPAAAVQADIGAAKQHYRWRSTKGCTNATVRPSIKFCNNYTDLEKELAFATDAAKLDSHIVEVQTRLSKIATAEAASVGDPQVEILSRLTGVDNAKVQMALIVLVALLVEIGSGLGFFVVLGNIRDTRARVKPLPMAEPVEVVAKAVVTEKAIVATVPVEARNDNLVETTPEMPVLPAATNEPPAKTPDPVEFTSVADELRAFYEDRIERADGSSITASTLYENYCVWAEKKDRDPMTLPAFGRKFSELGIQKAKIAGRIRYIGVRTRLPNEDELYRSRPKGKKAA